MVLTDSQPGNEESHRSNLPAMALSRAVDQSGGLAGVYEKYFLVRPYPSLRIIFTSPSLRVPGIIHTPLLDRIGGTTHMRDELVRALADGRRVTAKIKWLTTTLRVNNQGDRPRCKPRQNSHPLDNLDDSDSFTTLDQPGRPRWLHCTPLVGSNGRVGVWMIVVIDDCLPTETLARGNRNVVVPSQRGPATPVSEKPNPVGPANHFRIDEEPKDGSSQVRKHRSFETLGSHADSGYQEGDSTIATSEQQQSSGPQMSRQSSLHGKHPTRFLNLANTTRNLLARGSSKVTGRPGPDVEQGGANNSRCNALNTSAIQSQTQLSSSPMFSALTAQNSAAPKKAIHVTTMIEQTTSKMDT